MINAAAVLLIIGILFLILGHLIGGLVLIVVALLIGGGLRGRP